MIKRFFLTTIAAVALVSLSTAASAALIVLDPLAASWINVNPAAGITVDNSDPTAPTLRWGTSTGSGQSGYDFETAATPLNIVLPPTPSADFSLGDFTHHNNPITGTSLTSATLQIEAGVTVDGVDVGTRTFLFDFTHEETPNGADPCANGEPNGSGVNVNGCADIITVTTSTLSDSFLVGGVEYTLSITGFQATSGPDAGTIVSSFETVEEATNTAVILANADLTEVPEPITLLMFGSGLLLLAGASELRRRRSSSNEDSHLLRPAIV